MFQEIYDFKRGGIKKMKRKDVRKLGLCLALMLFATSFVGCANNNKTISKEKTEMDVLDFTSHDWELGTPAETIDVIAFNAADTAAGDVSARVLQGVINKKQPRVYIAQEWKENVEDLRQEILQKYGKVSLSKLERDESSSSEGYSVFWSIFSKYSDEIETIFVFSNQVELNDTINVAAMFASRYQGVAVNQELANQIIAAGYDLPVVDVVEYCGFTGENANAFAINRWISENMVEGASKSLVVSLNPATRTEEDKFLPTYYDFAVATNAVIYNAYYSYLDEGQDIQKSILDQYPDNTPVVGWPGLDMEPEYVGSISECGKTVVCADWSFNNGSIWSAFPKYYNEETQASVPEKYEIKNGNVYISFMVSDGDAWHYATGDFLLHWQNEVRGKQPIAWTIPSLFSIYNPLMLEYIYDTKTDMDSLVQGPSGVGYLYPGKTPDSSYQNFLNSTATILPKLGLNIVNVWDKNAANNNMVGDDIEIFKKYADATNVDAILRGHDSDAGTYEIYSDCVIIEEVGNFNGSGSMNSEDIVKAIDTIASQSDSTKPTFVVINVEAWGDCVAAIQPAIDEINKRNNAENYHFISVGELVGAIKSYETVENNE